MTNPTKTLMIQGTTSNAGKSFLTAALCRIFKQDGYRVAPFKSQNMALNSYITKDGLEMGRAQVMQAEAAGIEPTVEMNPILLKPTSHTGSQVIVNGEILGNMSAMDYYARKKQLLPHVEKAFQKLSGEYDIIVIEGAGSPAEINLKDNDIVNMGMARLAKAPVLLAGDIDRGGVFASLYGTVKLLEEEEQRQIKGLIINKFRGDVEILRPGLRMIEEKTGIPVVGVVPMTPLDLDDEDSLSERLNQRQTAGAVDIAVVHLPHISNFTDFNVFEGMKEISLRYVRQAKDLGKPDLLILPGTKNTMGDLQWLRESGLEAAILRQAETDTPVVGICGGYQMLGEELSDPHGVEQGGTMRGMGLLNARTVFEPAKTRTQIRGHILWGANTEEQFREREVRGYEIHMGRTFNLGRCRETIRLEDGRTDGLCNDRETVFGTYLHGIFDFGDLAAFVVRRLMEKKGLDPGSWHFDSEAHKQQEYDKLAALVRSSLDMDKIYKILEEGMEC
ncbi:MAG: cobyric acid synthase [Lachnospiraceae bacterium]|jgi:adenosylcobyric acid synthase|nr:cobyric acid synthase [Lachnospiraceae bacterium]